MVVIWLLWRKPVRSRLVAVLAIGIALPVLSVTARNYFVGKDLVLITSNAGVCFSQANNPLATGVFASLPVFTGVLEKQQQEEMRIASAPLGIGRQPRSRRSSGLDTGSDS